MDTRMGDEVGTGTLTSAIRLRVDLAAGATGAALVARVLNDNWPFSTARSRDRQPECFIELRGLEAASLSCQRWINYILREKKTREIIGKKHCTDACTSRVIKVIRRQFVHRRKLNMSPSERSAEFDV